MKVHIQTYLERDERGWWCVADVGKVIAETAAHRVEEVSPIRVGPWPSRQIARKELRGDFRKHVLAAVRRFVQKTGGSFEQFVVGDGDGT